MEFSQLERAPGRKFTGLGVVILLHALVIYALATGLARKVVEIVKPPAEVKVIEEIKPPPPPPEAPPPPPKMVAPPPPFIPPPEVAVASPQQPTIAAVSNVKPDNPVFAPPQPKVDAPPAKGPSRVNAVVDFNTCSKPEYPRSSQRNEEQGTVMLQFLIGLDGGVKDSKVERSSGYRDLDKAALRGLAQCKFKPAQVDGKPAETWSSVQYVWRLD